MGEDAGDLPGVQDDVLGGVTELALHRVGELDRQGPVERVSASDPDDMRAQVHAGQGHVAEDVEHLVARELVGEAQFVVDDAVGADDERVLVRGALADSLLAERLGLGERQERPRRRELLHEVLGAGEHERVALGRGTFTLVVEVVRDDEIPVGLRHGDQTRFALGDEGGRAHRETPAARIEVHDTRVQEHLGERPGAPVDAREFGGVDLDRQGVHPEAVRRGEEMLDRLDLRLAALQRGPPGMSHDALEVCAHRRLARQVRAHEYDPLFRFSWLTYDANGGAAEQANTLQFDFAADGLLSVVQYR